MHRRLREQPFIQTTHQAQPATVLQDLLFSRIRVITQLLPAIRPLYHSLPSALVHCIRLPVRYIPPACLLVSHRMEITHHAPRVTQGLSRPRVRARSMQIHLLDLATADHYHHPEVYPKLSIHQGQVSRDLRLQEQHRDTPRLQVHSRLIPRVLGHPSFNPRAQDQSLTIRSRLPLTRCLAQPLPRVRRLPTPSAPYPQHQDLQVLLQDQCMQQENHRTLHHLMLPPPIIPRGQPPGQLHSGQVHYPLGFQSLP